MTVPRRTAVDLILIVAIGCMVLVAGCGPGPEQSRTPTRIPSASRPGPSLTAVPGGPASPVVGRTVGPPTTTSTEFGPIFDALPPSFPKLPGQEPAETGAGPTSGSFAVNMGVDAASAAIIAGLKGQGWTVQEISSLEDGTVVVEEAGPSAGCKTEVRFAPVSGTLIMSVLYGASCPFS